MPTYDYGCKNSDCTHEFSQLQGIKEDALSKCPKCGKETLKRLIGVTHFNLKGGGWYSDGYGTSTKKTDE